MFPLFATDFPSSSADLARLLNQSLKRVFALEGDPVVVREEAYPHLSELTVSLDGAHLQGKPPQPSASSGPATTALAVDRLSVSASPLMVYGAKLSLSLTARGVEFGKGKDANDQLVLTLQRAAAGQIEISAAVTDLEMLIGKIAMAEAEKQGVSIDRVNLSLHAKDARSVTAEVRLRARKLFLSTSIQIVGQLDLDENLSARLSGLSCKGDGAMGGLACGFLTPHLQRLEDREFPLMSFSLGDVRLRDLELTVNDKVAMSAQFGSDATA